MSRSSQIARQEAQAHGWLILSQDLGTEGVSPGLTQSFIQLLESLGADINQAC